MKKISIKIILLVFILGVQANIINANNAIIDWSGFFDVQHNSYSDSTQVDGFSWGQFELDIDAKLSEKESIEGAVAYDNENQTFGLACGLVKILALENIEVAFGQFDVPVGIDYRDYASMDRPLVSAPLLNMKIYNGWNDLGARVSFENNNVDGVFYVVNGQDLQANKNTPQSAGGRLATYLLESEIGVSFAKDYTLEDTIYGADFTYIFSDLNIIAELLNVNNSASNKAYSYYIQTKYDFEKYFIVGRYGYYEENTSYDRDSDSYKNLARISLGIGVKIESNLEMRLEYQMNSENGNFQNKDNNALFLQTVVTF